MVLFISRLMVLQWVHHLVHCLLTSFYEKSWLADCPSNFKPLFYRRYVDDCFLIFQSRDHVLPFLSYLNSKYSNIQFTHELENNSSLPFLDVNVMRSNGSFTTSVHHKCTSIGLFTNFDSFIPMMNKKGLLFSLISRYFNICFSYISFQSEMENFKKTFSSNGYPKALIDSCIRHFLTGFTTPRTRSIHVPRKLFTFAFLSLDIMVYVSVHNLVKFLLLLIHIFPYVLFSVPLVAFLVSFHLKTGFPLP